MSIIIGNTTLNGNGNVKFENETVNKILFNGIMIWEKEKGKMKNCLFGNWKMNLTLQESIALVNELKSALDQDDIQVALAPSLVNIHGVHEVIKDTNIALIAQDVSPYAQGAYTGQVSAKQLAAVGVKYVFINHSEVRILIHNSDENTLDLALCANENRKISQCISNNLSPIIFVGESLAVREAGTSDEFLTMQLRALLSGLSADAISKCIISYEPIWAIGTGKTISAEEADRVSRVLRECIKNNFNQALAANMPILFAGSVNAANCGELYAQPDVNGFVVSGNSMKPEFVDMLQQMRE